MNDASGAATDMSVLGTACVFRRDRRQTMFGRHRDGQLVHIKDAERHSRDFSCPDCETPLVVKKGPVKIHHFAHSSDADCISAGETALHRLAKSILQEGKALQLPELIVLGETCQAARKVLLDNVEEETWEGNFRPDLRATMRGTEGGREFIRTLFIEIHVTHAVDQEKLTKIAEQGHSAVEIDLSKVNRDLNYQELAKLLRQEAPRMWLFHRQADAHQLRIMTAREQVRQRQLAAEAEAQKMRDAAAEVERAARRRPPAISAAVIDDITSFRLRWEAIGRGSLLQIRAEDDVFDLPPEVWRVIVLRSIAPWGDQKLLGPWQRSFVTIAKHATHALLHRKGIKPEFANAAWRYTGPAFEAVNDYLADALVTRRDQGAYGVSEVIGQALKAIRDDWASLGSVYDQVVQLQAILPGAAITVTGSGRPLKTIDDTVDWVAAQRRLVRGFTFSDIREPLRSLIYELENVRAAAAVPVERLRDIGFGLERSGEDHTNAFLQEMRAARDAKLTAEAGEAVETEVNAVMKPMERALDTLAALGPWPVYIRLDALPKRSDLHEVIWATTGDYYKRYGVILDAQVAKAIDQEKTIIYVISAITRVVDNLGVTKLQLGLRNVLARHAIKKFEAESDIEALREFARVLPPIAQIAKRLAQEELAGSRRIQGIPAKDFAWRSLFSTPKPGDRGILQSLLEGDIVEARRLTNVIATPVRKPAWIRADTPRFE